MKVERDQRDRSATLNTSSSNNRTLARIALIGVAAVLVAAWFATPAQSAWLPRCPFYQLTGLYCPGCGTTRMLFHLVHGHLVDAFRYNPVAFSMLPIVLYGLVRQSFAPRLPALPRISSLGIVAITVLIIVFTVARNTPSKPFSDLAPGAIHTRRHQISLSSPEGP